MTLIIILLVLILLAVTGHASAVNAFIKGVVSGFAIIFLIIVVLIFLP